MRFLRRRKRKPCRGLVGHRAWRTIATDEYTYIEECAVCGRQRARIFH